MVKVGIILFFVLTNGTVLTGEVKNITNKEYIIENKEFRYGCEGEGNACSGTGFKRFEFKQTINIPKKNVSYYYTEEIIK